MAPAFRRGGQKATPADPFSELCRKVALLVSDDWLVLQRCRPLLAVLRTLAHSLVVVTNSSGRLDEIEALGARVIDFDFLSVASNPVRYAAAAWALARILEAENPDVVHLVAARPIALGGLALKLVAIPHAVVHATGRGLAAKPADRRQRLVRAVTMRLFASIVRRPSSYLLVENADDLAQLRAAGVDPGPRFAVLGGGGIDPGAFPPLPPPANEVPVAAYIGRMVKSKGVDLLMDAYDRLATRGGRLQLELCGTCDGDAPDGVDAQAISTWCARRRARWRGRVDDVVEVWRHADFLVLPGRGGGAVSRTLLEAAACARPLIVSDVPGSRHFVRQGVEGLIVPPANVAALADAMQQLATDADLRLRMGEAARLRLLHGFTEAHVTDVLRASYQAMLSQAASL
jgi:glycosyltransferase involved in cell wall biosynthesis